MYHLMIVAYPESAAVIMVAQETEEVDAAEVYRDYAFIPDIIPTISKALDSYKGIEDCCCYGPAGYIEHVAKIVEEEFPQFNTTIEKAGV